MTAPDPLPLALDLMRVDSTSGREGEVVALAERRLRERGWSVQRIPVTTGRDTLLATSDAAPAATLCTHLDTVPPYIAPRVEGGRLYGRGACDAKGIAAAMVCAGEGLRDRGIHVALLFVVGEESCHDGAHAANASALRPSSARVLINGEPTESTLALGTKGALRFTLRTRGRAAHSAYPYLGESATARLVQLLAELDGLELPTDPLLGDTTVNIGTLAGGVADNVIAPWAEARLMARLVTSPDAAIELFTRWIGGRGEVDPGVRVPPVRLGVVPGFETSVAAFATDIPELTAWGTPYLFGPGSIHVAHTDDEYVELAELRAAVGAYERIVEAALAKR